MKVFYYIAILLIFSSCLKKIEAVETANTNIYDPEYVGDQWFVFDDLYMYTNVNNDTYIRFEFSIPEENAPELQPTFIDVAVSINGASPIYTAADVQTDGSYEGFVDILPTGATNFCMTIGVYVEEEDLIINTFEECKQL